MPGGSLLNGKPATKGIYIRNNQKVIVKFCGMGICAYLCRALEQHCTHG